MRAVIGEVMRRVTRERCDEDCVDSSDDITRSRSITLVMALRTGLESMKVGTAFNVMQMNELGRDLALALIRMLLRLTTRMMSRK